MNMWHIDMFTNISNTYTKLIYYQSFIILYLYGRIMVTGVIRINLQVLFKYINYCYDLIISFILSNNLTYVYTYIYMYSYMHVHIFMYISNNRKKGLYVQFRWTKKLAYFGHSFLDTVCNHWHLWYRNRIKFHMEIYNRSIVNK